MEEVVRGAALAFAAERYPSAELVVVAGSAARMRRPRSDIDLLVLGPPAMFPGDAEEAAHTDLVRGELFEVFASTPERFRQHVSNGVARLRPVSGHLLTDGVVVLDAGTTDGLQAWTTRIIAEGPQPSAAELAQRRYSVTNTLDDLLDAVEPAEEAVLAGLLFERLAELLLLSHGRWIGSGRWLLIRLREVDRPLADALGLALAQRDVAELHRLTLEALQPLGGRLMAGHRRL